MYIALTKPQIQFMIARNKQQITELESYRKALKNAIILCWNACNPLSNSVDSQSAFSSLNIMKDAMRDLRKEIKKLSEIQKALKMAAGEAAVLEKLKQQEPVATVECINGVTIGYLEVRQPIGTKLYAAPVPATVPDGVRGFSMWLNREEWGAVIDGLILERERSDARKSANSESTSNVRSGACVDLIKRINSESDRAMQKGTNNGL